MYSNENMVYEWEIVGVIRSGVLLQLFSLKNDIEKSQVQLDCLLLRILWGLISFISHHESEIGKCKGHNRYLVGRFLGSMMFLMSLFRRMIFNRSGFLFGNRYLLLLNWCFFFNYRFLFRCGNFFFSGGLFGLFWLLISRVVFISSGFKEID